MKSEMIINDMLSDDWEQVKSIYIEAINKGNATFDKEAPSWESWDTNHFATCRLVARLEGKVAGWAALTPVSSRPAFSGVAEVSIYISELTKGKGIGSALLKALIESSEQEGFWTLQSGIFPENIASLNLHYKYGFREVGVREKIGKLDGVWRNIVLLERRKAD
ncbi:GNAT family N-acetyltransferase [Metabacillus fastidiosus]|uniref:GNAT family N-acetyltransferase n=1 Tax=Metabacillus fastidiosus TaxID=1458 RepID=UPI002DBCFB79|nr:GNAT family N-acetyltransferase [Metabacillus fastidiosus]MEC2078129.1 GNAT family N-acetyltransferase [Metabacillus fastidiosus]